MVAPGSWVRGPYPGTPGYAHMPWWSQSWCSIMGWNPDNFYYVGGTSQATSHVSAIVALMLEADLDTHTTQTIDQGDVQDILRDTAIDIPPGSMDVFDIAPAPGWYNYEWEHGDKLDEATGGGLVQADLAVQAVELLP